MHSRSNKDILNLPNPEHYCNVNKKIKILQYRFDCFNFISGNFSAMETLRYSRRETKRVYGL